MELQQAAKNYEIIKTGLQQGKHFYVSSEGQLKSGSFLQALINELFHFLTSFRSPQAVIKTIGQMDPTTLTLLKTHHCLKSDNAPFNAFEGYNVFERTCFGVRAGVDRERLCRAIISLPAIKEMSVLPAIHD